MFPPTTMASYMAPFYSGQPGVAVAGHGHGSQSTSHLSRLHQLTQTLDIQGQPVPQSHVPHPSPPPQKQSKSSKSRAGVAAISHLHAATYNSQLQHYQYQAMLSNPALMYGQNHDNRSGMYPGYGTYYHR